MLTKNFVNCLTHKYLQVYVRLHIKIEQSELPTQNVLAKSTKQI